MRKPVTFILAATAAATAATVGTSAASAAPAASRAASGTEHIQVMSASTGPGAASAIARGVFTAAGQTRLGDSRTSTITFPGGTIVLSHKQAHGSQHFSPASCLSLVS